MFIQISDNLKKLSKFFPEGLYIVGGYVRNKLSKVNDSDVDLASSVDIEEVEKRLQGSEYAVKIKNLTCGTLLISKDSEVYEYTSFRKETYEDGGHFPSQVERTDKIEEDAARRDFTINSIYYNINKDVIVDFYHGIIDLKQKIVRCNIDPQIVLKNDGERILRMVRIACELNFKIDKKTFKAAVQNMANLQQIQGERKFKEIKKILYSERKSLKKSLKLLNVLGVWQYFGLKQKKVKYKMVFKAQRNSLQLLLMLLIDIVDTEKPECLQSFLGKFLQEQFGLNGNVTKEIVIYLSGYYDALSKMNNREFFLKYFEYWPQISSLVACKSKGLETKYNFFYQYIIEHKLAIKVADLAIDGNDIKKKFKTLDKRKYKHILSDLLSKVFDGELKNEKEELLLYIEKNIEKY